MPWRNLEAEIYCPKPAEIEYRDGMFHVLEQYSDTFIIRRCYTPETFLTCLRAAKEAVAKWQVAQLDGKVLPLR